MNFDADGRPILPAAKLRPLHDAVMARCDGLDGLVDGQLDDPRACDLDPGTLACPGADSPDCLTPAQVAVVRKIYSGAVTARGEHLYPGGQPYGSELAWAPWFVGESQRGTIAWRIGNGWVKYLAFKDNPPLSFTLNDIGFDRATFDRVRQLAGLYDAIDPDLTAFRNAGGKLILWHWADQAIPPTGTVAYYQAVQDRMGGQTATQRFARLFMFPGVLHCGGGTAPNTFDVVRSRPVFPYPLVARHTGTGSVDDAANFRAARPERPTQDRFPWLGRFE